MKRQLGSPRLLPLILWMAVIFTLSSQQRLPALFGLTRETLSVVGHLSFYTVLAVLLWVAIPARGRSPLRRLVLAFLGTVVFGVADEWRQSFVPGREPSVGDLALDATAAFIGLTLVTLIKRRFERMGRDR